MSALQHIRDYLAIHWAGHDIETLMQHFETAVEAKVEEAVAEVRQEMADLRADLIKPVTGGTIMTATEVAAAAQPMAEPAAPDDAELVPELAIETEGAT